MATLLPKAGTSAGLIGRFSFRNFHAGYFDGYVFDVSTTGTTGAWKLIKNNAAAAGMKMLAHGTLGAFRTGSWHTLSLSMVTNTSGTQVTITATVDSRQVTSYSDKRLRGPPGSPGSRPGRSRTPGRRLSTATW